MPGPAHATPLPFHLALGLPGRPSVSVTSDVLEHGQVRYVVRGRRLHGTLIVVPETPYGGPLEPRTVRVHFGDGTDQVKAFTPRPDEPVVNGVRIHGATESINPATVQRAHYFLASRAVVLRNGYESRRIPDGARTVTEALVVAVVRHWRQRPDRSDLIRAAARHRANAQAAYERLKVRALEEELAGVRADRAGARQRSRQLTGLVRRRQPPVQAPHAIPVRLPLAASDGTDLGALTVRELEVNVLPGRVVYEISGPRVGRGLVTLGPDIYGNSPLPGGLYACWGRPTNAAWFTKDRIGMPKINGVTVHGGWSHSGRTVTATSPDTSKAQVPAGPGRTVSVSPLTQRRAAAVLRALAVHFTSRRDLEALRIAAGKQNAERARTRVSEELDRLRRREAQLTRRLHQHRAREAYFTALLPPTTSPAARSRAA
ncbi:MULTISPECIES: hypothetical protein [Streptomyces]|uniref:hypothetical protein n=1 Tax=Streptomyces TaxID=1883 RepID=UPI000E685F85|nr:MULTISPECIES: hypothetical protein [Streptomyces]MDX3065563.1 hypothetical protein [Streptomyces sp. ND04-05B]MDX3519507.1 hypothetical protein [Streptomyces scabiei]